MDDCPICQEETSLLENRLLEEFGVDDEDDLPLPGQARACTALYVLGRLHETEHPGQLMQSPSDESIADCPKCSDELDLIMDRLEQRYGPPAEDGTLEPEAYAMCASVIYFLGRLHQQDHPRTIEEWSRQAAEGMAAKRAAEDREDA